jgi:hypothetical protein
VSIYDVCWQCRRTGHLRRDCPQRPGKVFIDKCERSGDFAAGGRANTKRQMMDPTTTRVFV